MTTKETFDVLFAFVGMVGAVLAFGYTMFTWNESQRWQRAEKLDVLIEQFEKSDSAQLACTALDWSLRRVEYRGKPLVLTSQEFHLSLRIYKSNLEDEALFPEPQLSMRLAMDAFLGFLSRVDVGIQSGLLDVPGARAYFSYWVERLVLMDRHLERTPELSDSCAAFIREYSDPEMIGRLCRIFHLARCIDALIAQQRKPRLYPVKSAGQN